MGRTSEVDKSQRWKGQLVPGNTRARKGLSQLSSFLPRSKGKGKKKNKGVPPQLVRHASYSILLVRPTRTTREKGRSAADTAKKRYPRFAPFFAERIS